MADEVTAGKSPSNYVPHAEGQFVAQCVDIVDLGNRVEQFPGKPKRVVPKAAIIFRTATQQTPDGPPIDISAECSVSMGEKANLRILLEAWRGKSYTDEQAEAGVPLHKLVGHYALISVEHKKAASSGNVYAKIKSISPVPAGLATTDFSGGYTRADYWAEKKTEYAKEVAALKQESARVEHTPAVGDVGAKDDDGLPF